MKKHYVLIDYENVQPATMEALDREHLQVIVFVGANQAKVTYEVASVLQRMGERASYIKITGNGSNALDFHIAFYLGRLAAQEPDAYFHVISKDTGFDPLIAHLKQMKILTNRLKSVADLPHVKATSCQSPAERASVVLTRLVQMGAAKPRTLKTLSSTIHALFMKSLSEVEVGDILEELTQKGIVVANQAKVSYVMPDGL